MLSEMRGEKINHKFKKDQQQHFAFIVMTGGFTKTERKRENEKCTKIIIKSS